eukprot:5630886-Prymnesium_polylepis.1
MGQGVRHRRAEAHHQARDHHLLAGAARSEGGGLAGAARGEGCGHAGAARRADAGAYVDDQGHEKHRRPARSRRAQGWRARDK